MAKAIHRGPDVFPLHLSLALAEFIAPRIIGVRACPYCICCLWVRGGWDLEALGKLFRHHRHCRRRRRLFDAVFIPLPRIHGRHTLKHSLNLSLTHANDSDKYGTLVTSHKTKATIEHGLLSF